MIALLLALAAAADRRAPPPPPPPATIDGLPIAGLAPQSLPAQGCSAYLFSAGQTRALAVVAGSDPASLRIALDGTVADYPRVAQRGTGDYGFAGVTDYPTARSSPPRRCGSTGPARMVSCCRSPG